jgi:hypothetical protein
MAGIFISFLTGWLSSTPLSRLPAKADQLSTLN